MSFSKRILLKISGESLMGESNYGLDISTAKFISKEIKKIYKENYQICLIELFLMMMTYLKN